MCSPLWKMRHLPLLSDQLPKGRLHRPTRPKQPDLRGRPAAAEDGCNLRDLESLDLPQRDRQAILRGERGQDPLRQVPGGDAICSVATGGRTALLDVALEEIGFAFCQVGHGDFMTSANAT